MNSVGQPQADPMGLPGLLGLLRGVMEMRFLQYVDGVGDGGLMSGCQIPVNPTIKSSVT